MMKLALLAALTLPLLPAAAEEDRNLSKARQAVKENDMDGDGRLSAAELGAGPTVFSMLDRNGDGFIDAAELAEAAPAAKKKRARKKEKTDRAQEAVQRLIKNLDRDGDGKVSPQEYPQDARMPFARLDANGDGFIEKAELRKAMSRGKQDQRKKQRAAQDPEQVRKAAGGLMKRLDKNQDGKITADEMPQGGRIDLAKADKNQDAAIDLFELTMFITERQKKAQGKDGQRRNPGAQLMQRVKQFDANQDGVITKDEWKGPEQYFARLDADRDGQISEKELKRAAKQAQGRWNNRRSDAFFTRFDTDKDGKIAADEWKMRPETFAKLDANGDGFVTKDEVMPQGPRNRKGMYGELRTGKDSARFLVDWDKNRDGQVDKKEFPHERRFAEIDANNDGTLSKAEIEDAMDKKDREAGYGFLERFDLNNDGKVTRDEFTGPAVAFERADKNHDGVVDAKDKPK